jgi:hypothetical protein
MSTASIHPSAAVISAVLQHADVCEDLGAGRALYRLSPKRLRNRAVRQSVGREAGQLASIAVLYDEREGQIIRVLDAPAAAPARAARPKPFNENDERWWATRHAGVAA